MNEQSEQSPVTQSTPTNTVNNPQRSRGGTFVAAGKRRSEYAMDPDPETIRALRNALGDYWEKDLDYYRNYFLIRWNLYAIVDFDNASHEWRWTIHRLSGDGAEQTASPVTAAVKSYDTYRQALDAAIRALASYYTTLKA